MVTTVEAVSNDGCRIARIDAALSGVNHLGRELRLIGRVSHAVDTGWVIADAQDTRVALDAPLLLPADLRPGDRLALPCRGAVALGMARANRGAW